MNTTSIVRGFAAVLATLALTSACGGGYTVPYDGARGPKRAKTDIVFYEIDCRDPATQPGDCIYSGAPLPWQVVGAFRVPRKATSGWESYRRKVADAASMNGCPAVAMRRFAPASSDGNAVGAFCVNPAAPTAPPPPPAGPGVGISVSATVTATTTECNSNADCPPNMKCARGACAP